MLKGLRTEQQHYPERTGFQTRTERYCRHSRARGALRDPAPPASSPRWGVGGAATMPRSTERRISMSKSAKNSSTASSARAPDAKPSHQTTGEPRSKKPDPGSKQSRVIAMLRSPDGTTIAAMMKATGWQQHSVRGFMAGVVRKKLKLTLNSKKIDGSRVYSIKGGDGFKAGSRQSKRRAA
jgi:hypothetical protein